MEFRRGEDVRMVRIPRRSIMFIQDEARYGWTHGIVPRKYDLLPGDPPHVNSRTERVSFTFRKVRPNHPCQCEFSSLCDSQIKPHLELDAGDALLLERLHVHQVYDDIAGHFSDTRHSQWPRVSAFLQQLPPGGLVADVGCGNGKYMKVASRPDLSFIGCDRSSGLLGICRQRDFNVFQADCLALPLRDEVFDAAICIAVIHHLASKQRRRSALLNLVRLVTRGTGRVLVYVWAMEQTREGHKAAKYISESKTIKEPTMATVDVGKDNKVILPVHTNRSEFKGKDMLVPWKKQEEESTRHRYYHVFNEGELAEMIRDIAIVEPCIVEDEYYDEGNWCAVIRRM